jgi:hypothetical protein
VSLGVSTSSSKFWGRVATRWGAFGSALLLVACGAPAEDDSVALSEAEVQSSKGHADGAGPFSTAFKHTNGRSCALATSWRICFC